MGAEGASSDSDSFGSFDSFLSGSEIEPQSHEHADCGMAAEEIAARRLLAGAKGAAICKAPPQSGGRACHALGGVGGGVRPLLAGGPVSASSSPSIDIVEARVMPPPMPQ
jgi:hypothetical protein